MKSSDSGRQKQQVANSFFRNITRMNQDKIHICSEIRLVNRKKNYKRTHLCLWSAFHKTPSLLQTSYSSSFCHKDIIISHRCMSEFCAFFSNDSVRVWRTWLCIENFLSWTHFLTCTVVHYSTQNTWHPPSRSHLRGIRPRGRKWTKACVISMLKRASLFFFPWKWTLCTLRNSPSSISKQTRNLDSFHRFCLRIAFRRRM